ncbi:MAG TPA: hypothetical protein VFC07_07745 [Verrucomicrobiae bacterium]|nr:hypothetical protein [Verrucomicrobiae bacterium]
MIEAAGKVVPLLEINCTVDEGRNPAPLKERLAVILPAARYGVTPAKKTLPVCVSTV